MKKRDEPKKNKRGTNPKSLKNLKPPIKPGEVRNPLGINRGRMYSDRIEEFGHRVLPEKVRKAINDQLGEEVLTKGVTWAESVAARLHAEVIAGNVSAFREITDRVEGKVTQRHEVTGAEGEPLIPTDIESLTKEEREQRRKELLAVIEGKTSKDDDDPTS